MSSPADYAMSFATQYYQVFDNNREGLHAFYHEHSLMSFESPEYLMGSANIAQKLMSLPFQKVNHAITTVDAQPTSAGGLLVVVNGQLKADDDPKMPFTQTFILMQRGDGLFIDNDIFRLGVHNF